MYVLFSHLSTVDGKFFLTVGTKELSWKNAAQSSLQQPESKLTFK